MLRRRLAVVALAGTALTGCASAPAPDRRAPEPSPTAVRDSTPSLTIDSDAIDDPNSCPRESTTRFVADPTAVEQLGGLALAVPFDRGPVPNASGTTLLDVDGVPVAYEVAPDDVLTTVGARLCVGEGWIRAVNAVRRDGDALFVGDTLNLDAHTILSVGDQNGVVHENVLPDGFVIPPQR